jgi:hypothetical protein
MITHDDLVWIAKVFRNLPCTGYEASFIPKKPEYTTNAWHVVDAEGDIVNVYCNTEHEAIQCASALNRLSEIIG